MTRRWGWNVGPAGAVAFLVFLAVHAIVQGPTTQAAQAELLREIEFLVPPPRATRVERVVRDKPGQASVGDRFRVGAPVAEVRSHYHAMLTGRGWKACGAHGRGVFYCRDSFRATLTFVDATGPGGWSFAIDLVWSELHGAPATAEPAHSPR